MELKVKISTEAILALESAAIWYEKQKTGLGNAFLDDFEDALLRIQNHPKLYPFFKVPLRKCLGRRFPFTFLYEFDEEKNQIFITGAWHQKQNHK